MTQGRITASHQGGQTLLSVNNYPIHGLVHKDFKFIKVNTNSKGNLVEDLEQFTQTMKDKLNAFVIDLGVSESTSQNQIKLKYSDEISISNYDVSPLVIGSRLCFSFEEHWDIL